MAEQKKLATTHYKKPSMIVSGLPLVSIKTQLIRQLSKQQIDLINVTLLLAKQKGLIFNGSEVELDKNYPITFSLSDYTDILGYKKIGGKDYKAIRESALGLAGLTYSLDSYKREESKFKKKAITLFPVVETDMDYDDEAQDAFITIKFNGEFVKMLQMMYLEKDSSERLNYVNLNFEIQKNLRSKHSKLFYEICKDLHNSKRPSTKKRFTKLELLRYLNVEEDSVYYKNIAYFNVHIVRKSIDEINEVTDIYIECDIEKKGREILSYLITITNNPKYFHTNSESEIEAESIPASNETLQEKINRRIEEYCMSALEKARKIKPIENEERYLAGIKKKIDREEFSMRVEMEENYEIVKKDHFEDLVSEQPTLLVLSTENMDSIYVLNNDYQIDDYFTRKRICSTVKEAKEFINNKVLNENFDWIMIEPGFIENSWTVSYFNI